MVAPLAHRRGGLRHRSAPAPSRPSRVSAASVHATIVNPSQTASTSTSAPSPFRSGSRELLHGREVEEAAMWACIDVHQRYPGGVQLANKAAFRAKWAGEPLDAAYTKSGEITAEFAKTFYLGTQLMAKQQAHAIWAIYVWCRRTDELVDGPNASRITPKALDRWQERLEAVFDGRPYDQLDAALTDTITHYPLAINPFVDMLDGMRMDLVKTRYETFDELYEYCYRVAGTVGLMSMPVMGTDPSYKGAMEDVYRAALALGTANQLTNILRDVGEDAQERNRIYVPKEDLDRFKISEREILSGSLVKPGGRTDSRWVDFMEFQITRANEYFAAAEAGVGLLHPSARLPVWSALIIYREILDRIRANGYDNLTRRAYVPKWKKFALLPLAYAKAATPPPQQQQLVVPADRR